jgi:metal-responsive CopG/Arc/MetJ family transcriptional regulator
MASTITVSIPEELREELDAAAERQGVTPGDLIRESLRKHLLLCEFEELRREMVPHAARQGIVTDQDVFDRVS